ncbi:PcfB family protein [Intestinimonas butyriciproducens]|uniref:PcfB family protein n=1 Tax=Intestinimonas butyriciproducens TaxID=1297617 RepID=UPI00189C3A4E|nr:PcfB family protein [Intestinimonas butyriciproducens]MDB7831416.1 PcfB family protein [Intestinimonas butyriciproducens]
MQEEVDQKTIALSIKTGKLTAQVLQAAIRKYLAARQKGKTKLHHGEQSLRQLKKDGSALSNIEITDANIGLFKPCAKKYKIDFNLRKDRSTHPPRYIVIFKTKEADNLEQAFKEFAAKKLQKEQKPSIRQSLSALKEKAAARTAQRAKEKIKERGLSL